MPEIAVLLYRISCVQSLNLEYSKNDLRADRSAPKLLLKPVPKGCESSRSDCETGSALSSAAGQDFASVCGLHSLTEAVDFFALTFLRLVGTEHYLHSFRYYTQHRERGRPEVVDI